MNAKVGSIAAAIWNDKSARWLAGGVSVMACVVLLAATAVASKGPPRDGASAGRGGGGSGGGGGGEEALTNNLSFPVIWADSNGPALTLRMVPGTAPSDLPPQALVTEPWREMVDGRYAYAQGVPGNAWQAENRVLAGGEVMAVSQIDWGDMLESAVLKTGSPARIEVTLYISTVTMQGFEMRLLANASSPDEVQGTLSDLQASPAAPVDESGLYRTAGEATLYSPAGKLVIQKLIGPREAVQPGDLVWNGDYWVDNNPDDPSGIAFPDQSVRFGGEVNVAGKVLYGLSQGGWRPKEPGDYRLTFYLPKASQAQFDVNTTIRKSIETAAEGGSATAVVDPANNLTYIDVRVVGSGGGGGGKGGGSGR